MSLSFATFTHYNRSIKMCEVKVMEAILNSLVVDNQKVQILWKQILCAIFLALALAGLYANASGSAKERIEPKKAVMVEGSLVGIIPNFPMMDMSTFEEKENEFTDPLNLIQKGMENKQIGTTEETEETMRISTTSRQEEIEDHQTEISTVADSTILSENDRAVSGVVPIEDEKEEQPAMIEEIKIELYGNGGVPECITDTCKIDTFEIGSYKQPERLGKIFDGWYLDQEGSIPFSDIQAGEAVLKLYAGWKEFPGFLSNEKGYITGYTDESLFLGDGLLSFPTHDSCKGVAKNALKGLEEDVFEIYIPANITYIEPGSFDYLSNLLYIEVSSKNPAYESIDGCVYTKDGKLIASPKGWE